MSAERVAAFPSIDELLGGKGLGTAFQPILELTDGEVHAVEALARHSVSIVTPDAMFDYANRKGRTPELDLLLMAQHLRHGGAALTEGLLFVNLHPDTLVAHERVVPVLEKASKESGFPLSRLVLEITEQASIPAGRGPLEALSALVDRGVRLALDDVGSAYSHFTLLEHVPVHYMKLTHHYGQDLASNPARRRVVRNLVRLARDFDMDVILEGIEHTDTVAEALALGIRYGQGYALARPQLVIGSSIAASESVRGFPGASTFSAESRASRG